MLFHETLATLVPRASRTGFQLIVSPG